TGDINDIVPPSNSVGRSKLRLGTYYARETTETVVSASIGKGLQSYPTVRIKIVSVDSVGAVKADFMRFDKVGHLNGSVDSNGDIALTGYLNDAAGNEWKVALSTNVNGSAFTNGTYSMKTLNGVEIRGVFKVAELEE